MIETRHDTLDKVNQALTKLGWTEPQVVDAINEMLNLGVVFAERVKDDDGDDDEMTPEERAAWDALTPEEQVAIAFAPLEVPLLPEISIKRGGLRWPVPSEVQWCQPTWDEMTAGVPGYPANPDA